MRHDGYEDPHTLEPVPADAGPDDDDATFRLPYPEEAAKNSDGSYQYRVYDAKKLWRWVRERRPPIDPVSKVPLLKRDWEELRDRYSDAVTDPTPSDRNFRRPITNGLWPPRLNNYNIRPAVQEAVRGVARLQAPGLWSHCSVGRQRSHGHELFVYGRRV